MRVAAVAVLAASALLAAGPAALAQQSNPSAQQIINSLKPSGNLGTSRGIRLAPEPAPAQSTAPATATPATPAAATPAPQAQAPTVAPVTPAATAQPAPHPAQPATTTAAATPAQAAPSVNLNVEFATDSAALTPAARHTLDALGQALSSKELASYRFRIEGHTDTTGNPSYNLALSQRRANAVAAYIEQKFGISSSRLQAVGMGEKGLLVPTPPNTPEPKNRRVQVVNIGS